MDIQTAEVWVRILSETTWFQASFWIQSAAKATLSSDASMCLIWGEGGGGLIIIILPFSIFFHFPMLFYRKSCSHHMIMCRLYVILFIVFLWESLANKLDLRIHSLKCCWPYDKQYHREGNKTRPLILFSLIQWLIMGNKCSIYRIFE